MRATHSARAVVVNKEGNIILVSQRGQAWVLPGGHIEVGERKIEAAKREIYEETGIESLEFVKELGTYKREKMVCESIDSDKEIKVITVLLFTTNQSTLTPHDKDNPEARWIKLDEVEKLLTHPKDKAFFRKIKDEIKPTKSI